MNLDDNFYNDILSRIIEQRDQNTLNVERIRSVIDEFRSVIEGDAEVKITVVKIIDKKEKLDKGVCNICYENNCNIESNCNHYYCEGCIKKWIKEKHKTSCPFCRQNLEKLNKYTLN